MKVLKDYEVGEKEIKNEIIAGLYSKDDMKVLFEKKKFM